MTEQEKIPQTESQTTENAAPQQSLDEMLAAAGMLGSDEDYIGDDAPEGYTLLPEEDELPADHRSGFVAVIGRPNVGKSTLLNRILDQKIAITSPKPQTTRDQILGIYTTEKTQVLFLDTPGIHKPENKLGSFMMEVVATTIGDADVVLWLVDVNTPPTKGDLYIAEQLQLIHQQQRIKQIVLGLNKLDAFIGNADDLQRRTGEYLDQLAPLVPTADSGTELSTVAFSGETGDGVDALLDHLRQQLPLGPRYYAEDEVTDVQVRFIVEELIREKALMLYQKEVPHSIAVGIDEFTPRDENMTYISAVLYVERESQKKIVLGSGGKMIKRLGQSVRPEIETLIDTRVYLELWVKVWEKWRKKEPMLRRLGYAARR